MYFCMARILCIDDEPKMVELKRAILEQAGHEVIGANSAHEAFDLLANQKFDAIVTDWRLGDDTGRSVLQSAKAQSNAPVVVVSGYIVDAYQAAEPQADLYLEKPVNPEELLTVVNELLKAREREAQSEAHSKAQSAPESSL